MGRTRSVNGRRNQLKVLNERHREIARRTVLGEAPKQIAEDLGISRELVSIVKGSAAGQEFISELECGRDAMAVDIGIQLRTLCPDAIEVLREALRGNLSGTASDYARLRAAKEVLDRAGYAKVQKVKPDVQQGYMAQVGKRMLVENALKAGFTFDPETSLLVRPKRLADESEESEE